MADQEQAPQTSEAAAGGTSPDPQVESRARDMGWIPKEEFRGDQSKWIDATAFVERADSLLPIVRAENRRLQGEVSSLRGQLSQSAQATQELRQSIEDLKKFNTEIAKDRVKTTRTSIAAGIKAAREAGDVERELELQDQLNEANEALREAEASSQPARQPSGNGAPATGNGAQPPAASQQAPEFIAWQQANPWFGGQGEDNERRTHYALAAAQTLRGKRPDLVGKKEFFDQITAEVQAVFSPPQRRTSKVEGSNGSERPAGAAPSGGKTFADLPADAQAVAKSQAKRFVGANKAFKTEAEWFSHYTSKYFERD